MTEAESSMTDRDSETDLLFLPEDTGTPVHLLPPWKVLVVDDDPEVHEATVFGLRDVLILGRPLQLLHAHSGAAALALLEHERDVAVVLLDVVMETVTAGLDIVSTIRDDMALLDARIILRTGQPGYAPDERTVAQYDINDYRTKSELTRSKLFIALFTAIRAYDQLCRAAEQQRFLRETLNISSSLIDKSGLSDYAAALIEELQKPFETELSGFVALVDEKESALGSARLMVAGEGFTAHKGKTLAEFADAELMARLRRCALARSIVVEPDSVTVWVALDAGRGLMMHARARDPLVPAQMQLLQVLHQHLDLSASKVFLTERLHGLAYYDTLVGLPNRSALLEAIKTRHSGPDGSGWVVGVIDIDRFGEINDMFGHAQGDLLLMAVSQRLPRCLGPHCLVARIGADVFGLFCAADALELDALQALCSEPFDLDGKRVHITVSIGLDQTRDTDTGGEVLLKNASLALKRAKAQGCGQLAWYSPELEAQTREHMRLLQAFTDAPKLGQLYLAYQPQWALATGEITGFEALMRWRTADGSHVPPDAFIPVAESSGLILETGRWALLTALQAVGKIRRAGLRDFRMAVNISVTQFQAPGFVQMVREALGSCAVEPGALELEITESVAMTGAEQVLGCLHELKAMGVAVAIDDFGTGYSSLSYLDRMPADRLKIDRSFISGLGSGARSAQIAEMVVPIGHRVGMKVLAEGVETLEQARILAALGCDEGQGYLLARPMPLSELLEWLPLYQPLEGLR
ncbi:MAG: response regulator receiver protein [Methylibium sp.]|nr:response regulator receiver protein [Methylibium sp.]